MFNVFNHFSLERQWKLVIGKFYKNPRDFILMSHPVEQVKVTRDQLNRLTDAELKDYVIILEKREQAIPDKCKLDFDEQDWLFQNRDKIGLQLNSIHHRDMFKEIVRKYPSHRRSKSQVEEAAQIWKALPTHLKKEAYKGVDTYLELKSHVDPKFVHSLPNFFQEQVFTRSQLVKLEEQLEEWKMI